MLNSLRICLVNCCCDIAVSKFLAMSFILIPSLAMLVPLSAKDASITEPSVLTESAVAASIALADVRSVCLNIVDNVLSIFSAEAPSNALFKSPKISPRPRILPVALS